MISIQLWRARIGLFNAKRHSGPRSSFSSGSPAKGSPLGSSSLVLLHEKSSIPPTAHSPICDTSPGPSTDHECALSDSLSSSSTVSISPQTRDKHKQSAVYTSSKFSARLSSKTVHSLLSSMTDELYLPNDLLKDALVMLLVAIISQLLVLSGDIETNPGPIASDKPAMYQLISLKKTDGSGECLQVIEWITSLSHSKCVDFAHLLLVDPVKVGTHQKKSSTDRFVRAVLLDWLSSGDDSRAVPRTWKALADCVEAAGLPGDLVKAIRETCPSGSPRVRIEKEDVSMLPAKKPRVSPHFDSSEDSHGPIKVVVEPDIPKQLLALMEEYSDMLVVLQTAILSEPDLKRLKLFLSGYCDESSLEDCPSPKEIVKQLIAKLRIYIFSIDALTACCKYFRDDEVSQSVQKYKKHLNMFLSTTSVKELQFSLQTVTCHDDMDKITLKLNETASNDILKNLEKLVHHFLVNNSKPLILYEIRKDDIIVPASLVSTLRTKAQQLSPASKGVLELVIGVPNEDYVDQDVAKKLMKIEAIMKITNISTQGYPGIGKTSVLDLAMGKLPAGTRTSTDFADPPSRYMMLNSNSEGVIQWKNVTNDEMANMVYGAMKTKNPPADKAQPDKPTVVATSQPSKSTSSSAMQFEHAASSISAFSSPNESDPSPGSSFSDYSWFPELLRDLHNSEKSDVIFNSHWVFISDCGGQPPFLDAAALFCQNSCLQIFPLKLNEPLNKTPKCSYYANGESASFDDTCLKLTHQQTIEALAKSVALIQPPYLAKQSDSLKRTKFTIVGTFADVYEKMKKDDCTETVEKKESILSDVLKPCSQFLVRGNKIILQVNATTSDLEERNKFTEQLQQLIFDASDITITVTVKLLWFVFYHRLLIIAEEQHKSVFTLDECYRLGKFLGMDSNLETKEALQQFHDIGLIMHFDTDEDDEKMKKLSNSVVIKIESVFKNVSRLISVSFLDRDFLSKHLKIFPPTGHKERLQSRGFFKKELLDKCICIESTKEPKIDAQLLLDILEHVKAITAIKDTTDYFMPCALPYAPENKLCEFHSCPPWVIRLKVQHGIEVSYISIPCSYLPTLIIFLLTQENSPFTIDCDTERQYRDVINLQYNERGTVAFVEYRCRIEVTYSWYEQFPNDCSDIRTLILEALRLTEKRLNFKTGTIKKVDSFLCSCDGSDDRHLCTSTNPFSGTAKCEKTKKPLNLESCWLSSAKSHNVASKHASGQQMGAPNVLLSASGTHESNNQYRKRAGSPLTVNLLLETVSNVTEWHCLGRQLGLTMSQLGGIELTYHMHGLGRLKAEMFDVWLKSSPNASWADLITALEAMGMDRVASNVRAAYSPSAPV